MTKLKSNLNSHLSNFKQIQNDIENSSDDEGISPTRSKQFKKRKIKRKINHTANKYRQTLIEEYYPWITEIQEEPQKERGALSLLF